MNQNNFENNNGYPTDNQNNLGYQPTTPVPQPVDLMAPQQTNPMVQQVPVQPVSPVQPAVQQPDLLAPQAPVDTTNQQSNLMRPVITNDVNLAIPPQVPSPDYNPNGVYDPNFNAGMSSYQPGMMNQPVIDRQMQTISVPEVPKQPKDKKKIFKIVGIVALVALLAFGIFFVIKFLFNKDGYTFATLTETDSFFLKNEEGYYALFNEDGEQLSEFVFDDVDTFYGGVAVVSHKDGRDGAIKENGKYLVDLGEPSVYGYYGLINVVDYSTEKFGEKLLSFNGNNIAEGYTLDIDNYAYGALFIITKYDINSNKSYQVVNYAGKDMGTLANPEEYTHYSYDGEYVTLISEDKTILYNIEKAEKVLETDGNYCVTDGTSKAVVLNSCSIDWWAEDEENTYKVVLDKKVAYTIDSEEYNVILTEDGKILRRAYSDDYYTLLDDKGNVKQEGIIGYQNGKNYIVEEKDRLMFYKNGERQNIVDCASYYQNADEKTYIIKVDRYADGCKDDINNQYSYYDLSGKVLSESYYSASAFNGSGRAIVGTENLEKYLINDKYEVVSGKHYSIQAAGYLYIVWDEDYNQALMDKDGNLLEEVVEKYTTIGNPEEEDSFVAVVTKEDTFVVYNSKTGKKVTTVEGEYLDLYEHYFVVDRDGKDHYYSYYTGKSFYSAEN